MATTVGSGVWSGDAGAPAAGGVGVVAATVAAESGDQRGERSAGGAGKTPMALLLTQILRRRGYAVSILSRGYGRRWSGRGGSGGRRAMVRG